MSGTLRLFLDTADGVAATSILACRAAGAWSEFSVFWFAQPPAVEPCAATVVGPVPGFYEWDISEFIEFLDENPGSNFGLVLVNPNDHLPIINERDFFSRNSFFAPGHPELLVRYVRVPTGIESSFDLTETAEGDLVRLLIAPDIFEDPIYEVELFFEEQAPRWTDAQVLNLPDGWFFDVTTEDCEIGPAESDVVRLSTESNPLTLDNEGDFELRVQRDDTVPTEIVQLELRSAGGQLIGKLPVPRVDTPTPTATPTPTPTTEIGCCEVDGGCASGSPVTRGPCEELGGVFFLGGDCNLETGQCDGVPVSTATRTRTLTRTPTRTHTPVPTPTNFPTTTPTGPPPTVIQLDLDIFRLDGSELRDDEGGQPNDELTVGSMTCVNNDNDDQDPDFDIDDGDVAGEDDLVKMVVQRPPGLTSGQVELRQIVVPGATGGVRVWDVPEKQVPIDLPVTYDITKLPENLWIEGIQGSTQPRDVQFELRLLAGSGEGEVPVLGKPDQVALTVVEITQTEWMGKGNSLNDDDTLDADPHDPHWANAQRVFPGARTRGGAVRDTVKLKVTLSVAPVEELDVFLRAFDVDDPVPLDADDDPNDDGSAGNYRNTTAATTRRGCQTIPGGGIPYTAEEDNRGQVGSRRSGRIDGEDASGIATLTFPAGMSERETEFQVTKQPGDNFRIAAACDRDFLVQLRNRDEDDAEKIVDSSNEREIPNADQRVSPVLTVWRRMHVERDSMRAFSSLTWWRTPNENTITGLVTQIRATGSRCTDSGLLVTVLEIDQRLEQFNQYTNGAIFVESPGGFLRVDVISNSRGAAPNFLTVCGTPGGPTPARFRLHDDDVDSILSRVPDTGWMQDTDNGMNNLYAAAYVRPIYDGGGNAANDQTNVTLDVHTTDPEAPGQIRRGKNVTGTVDFWVAYIQSVFQGGPAADWDPGNPDGRPWDKSWELGYAPLGDGAILYQENITDVARHPRSIANGATRQIIERATAVHEVGHELNADHCDGQIMDAGWPTRAAVPRQFSSISLNRIRSTSRPGGGTP